MRFISLFLIAVSLAASAQVKVDGKATGRHADAINRAKGAKQTAEEQQEQARKLQQQTKARELYRQKYDSIKNERMTSDSMTMDSTNYSNPLADSLEIANQVLNETDFPPEYKVLILNPIELEPELNAKQADSIALAEAAAVLETEARKFMPDEMRNGEDPLKLSNPALGLNPLQKPTKPNPNLVKPDAARELFKKVDPGSFKIPRLIFKN